MSDKPGTHENFDDAQNVKIGSERSFGIVFAVVFVIVALLPLWSGEPLRLWALTLGAGFAAAGFLFPRVLRPLNIVWFRFGLLLSKIVNPLVMALLFFLTVTPIAIVMRIVGKDPLQKKFDPDAESYWIERDRNAISPESMRRQF